MKSLVIILMLVFTIPIFVSAVDLDSEVNAVIDKILPDESASFDIILKNRETNALKISLESPDVITSQWSVLTSPISDMSAVLGAGNSKNIRLNVKPIGKGLVFGAHRITLEISAQNMKTGEKFTDTKFLNIIIKNPNEPLKKYAPTVFVTPEYPENINPLEGFSFNLLLDNRNSRDLSDLQIRIASDVFSVEHKTSLKPYAKQTINFEVIPNRYAEAGTQELLIEVISEGSVITSKKFDLNVQKLDLPFDLSDKKTDRRFLKSTTIYTVHNSGNVPKEGEYLVPVSLIGRMLSESLPEAEVVDGNYVLSANLAQNEEKVYEIEYSYVGLFIIIIIILILLAIYHMFKPEIYINRRYVRVKVDEEHNFISCKVIVHIKNMSSHILRSVRVKEVVPGQAHYVPASEGLPPTKVHASEYSSSSLIWGFDELEPKDERILTYHINGTFKVMGGFDVPATTVSFDKAGIRKTIYGGNMRIEIRR